MPRAVIWERGAVTKQKGKWSEVQYLSLTLLRHLPWSLAPDFHWLNPEGGQSAKDIFYAVYYKSASWATKQKLQAWVRWLGGWMDLEEEPQDT